MARTTPRLGNGNHVLPRNANAPGLCLNGRRFGKSSPCQGRLDNIPKWRLGKLTERIGRRIVRNSDLVLLSPFLDRQIRPRPSFLGLFAVVNIVAVQPHGIRLVRTVGTHPLHFTAMLGCIKLVGFPA
jgi:hypothetical protein